MQKIKHVIDAKERAFGRYLIFRTGIIEPKLKTEDLSTIPLISPENRFIITQKENISARLLIETGLENNFADTSIYERRWRNFSVIKIGEGDCNRLAGINQREIKPGSQP